MTIFACTAAPPLLPELLYRGGPDPRGTDSDSVSFGREITVRKGETASDVVCAFCTVRIRGDVKGDVALFFGSVIVDPGRSIAGDVALLGGDVTLGEGSSVDGDMAVFGGEIKQASGASVRGDKVVLPGRRWILLLTLAPLLILAGIVWLIIWLVGRARYGAPMVRRS